MKTSIAPINAVFDQIARVTTDHCDVGDFSLSTDGYTVVLSEQPIGHPRKQGCAIPRTAFNRMVKW